MVRPRCRAATFERVFQSWDLTFTDSATSDYVVGQVWGIHQADRYLLRQTRARLGFNATLAAIRQQTEWVNQHHPGQPGHQILIERAANSAAVTDVLKSEIAGITLVVPEGDKINRAHAVCPQIESGNVYLPGAPDPDRHKL